MKAAHGLLLLLGLLLLMAELPPSMGQKQKPGRCPTPPPGTVTPCIVKCGKDRECPGKKKCCSYGCMIDCMDPV